MEFLNRLIKITVLWTVCGSAFADVLLTADQAIDRSWTNTNPNYCDGANCVTGEHEGYAGRYSAAGTSAYRAPDGTYGLSLWNICFYTLDDQTYQIHHDGGITDVVVPQSACGQWVDVGQFSFTSGQVVLDASHRDNKAHFVVQVAALFVDGGSPLPPPDGGSPPPPEEVPPQPSTGTTYDFVDCSELGDWVTHQPEDNPNAGCRSGYFFTDLIRDTGSAPYTGSLFYSNYTGRMDGTRVSFPFTVTAYDVGVSTLSAEPALMPDPGGQLYSGIVGRSTSFDNNWFHAVVGWQNGEYVFEWKQTTDGESEPVGALPRVFPSGRADIRVIGEADCSISFEYRDTGESTWNAVPNIGQTAPDFRCSDLYVGPMTYGTTNPAVQFTGSMGSMNVSQ